MSERESNGTPESSNDNREITNDEELSRNIAGALTRFSLDRRITVFVVFLSLVVIGLVASFGLKQELMPDGFEGKTISVSARWTNAPTREVFEKITIPLEEELATVKGLDRMYSSSRLGYGRVSLKFKTDVDMDIAYREIRDRVERARLVFPDEIERPRIRKADASGIPIYVVGLVIDPALNDYYDLIQQEVVMQLERIDGVASVDIDGFGRKEIIIEVDRSALESAGLNVFRLSRDLGDDNFTLASGHTYSAGKKYFLRSVSTFDSLDDIKNRLIAPNIRLSDVASIKYEEAERNYEVRVNSKRALTVKVIKEGSANTVEIATRVDEVMEEIKNNPRLQLIQMKKMFSQGDVITSSISNLVNSGKIGGILAAVVLFFFLRRARLTLIITFAIPLSLLVALTAMFFMGESLNVVTLLGLVICVGLLVDNAVVVAENIQRILIDEGISKREACIKGAGEIALAILTATLTTIIVFLPVSLVDGEMQFFLLRLAIPITVSLAASLFIALIFIPLCVYLTSGNKTPEKGRVSGYQNLKEHLKNFYDMTFGRVNLLYNKCLAFFLTRRIDLLFVLIAMFSITNYLAQDRLEVSLRKGGKDNQVKMRFSAQKGTEYSEIKNYFKEIETVLHEHKNELQIKDFMIITSRFGGRIEAWFEEHVDDDIDVVGVAAKIAELIPEKPGYKIRYGQEDETDERERNTRQTVMINGENPELLEEIGEQIAEKILKIDGVIGLMAAEEESPNELALVVDRERIIAANVDSNSLARVVSSALGGRKLNDYIENGREIPMRMRYQEADREQLADLESFYVPTENDGLLTVASLTESKMLNSAASISRREKKISYRMSFELDEGKANNVKRTIKVLQSNMDLPEGISFNSLSSGPSNDDKKNMAMAVLLSIVFIYLLMGFLFESFILPLSILLTIPLAMIGVQVGHLIAGIDIDSLGVVGAVLLVGVVVNNGIVLVDYIQRLRDDGYERREAILVAAKRRFRPIAMTALTTIIGMIPIVLSPSTTMGVEFTSFGITLICGMTAASFLTLLVVPVFYTFFDDFREGMANLLARAAAFKT